MISIHFKVASRNVIAHWRQSFASVASISAAFLTLVVFQGYLMDVDNLFVSVYRDRTMFGDLIFENKDLFSEEGRRDPQSHKLSEVDQEFIRSFLSENSKEVLVQSRFLNLTGMLSNGRSSLIFSGYGYDLEEGALIRGERWRWNSIYGIPLEQFGNQDGLAVGQTLGRLLECVPDRKRTHANLVKRAEDDKIGFSCKEDRRQVQLTSTTDAGRLNAVEAEVVGFIDGGFKDIDAKFVNMSLEKAQTLLDTKAITYMVALLKRESDYLRLAREFNLRAKTSGRNLHAINWRDHIIYGDTYVRAMEILRVFKNFVVVIILTIAALSVLNTLVKVVKERTKEVGTLRSLGYRPRDVLLIFGFEAIGLAAIGNLMGVALSLLLSAFINQLGLVYKAGMFVEPVPFNIEIDLSLYMNSFVFLVFLSLLACWISLRLTLKQKVSENLTYA